MASSNSNPTKHFVHTLLRARDWQHRPEFEQVCDWWQEGGQGVCGLVGIGGAGKTATVDRFLQVLPGVMPQSPDIPKDETLRMPDNTFVFSFYDAPNAEAFFEYLQMWLEQSPDVEATVSYSKLLFRMQNAVPGLIVLDGLEKVQEDGTRGIFGQLSAPNLRDFVKRAANGQFSKLSILITTRFPIVDLQEEQPVYFQSIPIEKIDSPTGIKLLRQRGVKGNALDLERIVGECGNHALTVDFAGGYIKEYGNGDPNTPLTLGNVEELEDVVCQEQDAAKRAVLKQGFRFARVAQRYREAISEHDPAAVALLERICLFRLGVEAKTLVAIFTGEQAVKVSGTALAKLNAQQLQRKLDWLVQMRIIEVTRIKSRQNGQISTLYNIHPAVRDGFLQGIGRETAHVSHKAICTGLEVSLGDAPGANPSDSATLDLLEEIVFHAIASGQVPEAYSIHRGKIGGYENLGWRLGAYERGDRICQAFCGGQLPEKVASLLQEPQPLESMPCLALTEAQQVNLINEWALYLIDLGRLEASAHCYEAILKLFIQQEDWTNASTINQHLSRVWRLAGRLRSAHATAREALRLANKADDTQAQSSAFGLQGSAQGDLGGVSASLEDFHQCLHWQNTYEGNDNPLWGPRGVPYYFLLNKLGRHDALNSLLQGNIEVCRRVLGNDTVYKTHCSLILANLSLCSDDVPTAQKCYESSHHWALARDSKEILCWAALVKTRIELAEVNIQQPKGKTEQLRSVQDALTEGLKIARNCGYGIYHIDLLLEQARLHLLQGNPQAALDDIRLALDDGIPANDLTRQPELLAASNPECGYVWGIVEGLHRLAQALLLQAAQTLGKDYFAPARRTELPVAVQDLITQAETSLQETMARLYDLRDPEVSQSNFINPETNKEYNYRAAETYQVQKDLQGGILTHYPLTSLVKNPPEQMPSQTPPTPTPSPMTPNADEPLEVFISYSHKDDDWREELDTHLANLKHQSKIAAWYDRAIEAGEEWETQIKGHLESAQIILLLVSPPFMASNYCYDIEMQRAIDRHNEGTARVIPILLRPCDWKGSPFSKLQVLPKDAKPVTKWADRDEAFLDVVNGIRRAVESLTKK